MLFAGAFAGGFVLEKRTHFRGSGGVVCRENCIAASRQTRLHRKVGSFLFNEAKLLGLYGCGCQAGRGPPGGRPLPAREMRGPLLLGGSRSASLRSTPIFPACILAESVAV